MQGQSVSYYSKMPKTIKLYRETFVVGSCSVLAPHSRPAAMECTTVEACCGAKLRTQGQEENKREEAVRSHNLLPITYGLKASTKDTSSQ